MLVTVLVSAQVTAVRYSQNRLIKSDEFKFKNGYSQLLRVSVSGVGFKYGRFGFEWWYAHLDVYGSINTPIILKDTIEGRLSTFQIEIAPIGIDVVRNKKNISIPIFSSECIGNSKLKDFHSNQFNPFIQIGVNGGILVFVKVFAIGVTTGIKYDFSNPNWCRWEGIVPRKTHLLGMRNTVSDFSFKIGISI